MGGLGKILLLVVVIAAVWFGFRWYQRSGLRLTVERRGRKVPPTPLDLERNPATGAYEPRRDDLRQ